MPRWCITIWTRNAKYIDSIAGDSYTEPHFLDLDGNGTIDVEFAAWSSVQSKNGPNMVNLAGARQMGPIGNAIMGYTNLFSASICSTPLALFCPSVLNDDDLIGPGANFWAVVNTFSMGTLIRYFKDEQPPNNFVGQWNNLNDRYMGLKFGDSNGDLHYGWIRLDVSKSPASITVKDYAYEVQNAVAIKAGDMGNVGVSTPAVSETFNIFLY
jgi:hypothetical protein